MNINKILIILVGGPGTGKTTYCKENLSNYFRISQDDMGKNSHLIKFKEVILEGYDRVVIDRMNFNKQQRSKYIDLAREKGYTIKIIILNCSNDECIKRVKERKNHPTLKSDNVEKVLKMFWGNFEYPTKDEYDLFEEISL